MGLGAEGPIALIAGSGRFPVLVADALVRAGREHRIMALRGFTAADLRRRADAVIDLLDVSGALARLREWKPAAVTSAGGVQRPSPAALLGAISGFRNRHELSSLVARGDDGLLRGVISLLEGEGHAFIGAHEVAPGLLAPGGILGRHGPSEEDRSTIAVGLAFLKSLSAYDVGQAAVVSGSRVLAVEGPEGTDRMLRRAGRLGGGWTLGRRPKAGVLVKAVKLGQDLRIDMPAIGARTVQEAKRAGLRGIAVGAGSTLILDRAETVEAADRLGLFLVGAELPSAS